MSPAHRRTSEESPNPAGEDPLLVAAKPLASLLCSSEVTSLAQGTDISSRYLAFKKLPSATKSAILKQSGTRDVSDDMAHAVVDSLLVQPGLLREFLDSRDAEIRGRTTELLVQMACHEFTPEALASQHGPPDHWRAQRPLLRPQTSRQSLQSCWSDSNFVGATISIHAAAKPLMRFMYHRDAIKFIEKNRHTPPSTTTEIYSGYLGYKYVADTTKAALLRDLEFKAVSEDGAHAVADLLLVQPDLVEALLNSPSLDVRVLTCRILGRLGKHETRPEFISLVTSWLGTLLSDDNPVTVDIIIETLTSLIALPDSAEVRTLLQCRTFWILGGRSRMVPRKASRRQSREGSLNRSTPCASLVSLLSHDDPVVVDGVIDALTCCFIPGWPDGAQPPINAEFINKLLDSPIPWGKRPLHRFLESLALASINPCPTLVSRLNDSNPDVGRRALYALTFFIQTLEGAHAAMAAGILEVLDKLIDSPNPRILRATCLMLGHLAQNDAGPSIVFSDTVCIFLVSRLREVDRDIRDSVISALYHFVLRTAAAPGAFDSTLSLLPDLLKSTNAQVQRETCRTLGLLAVYESTLLTVLDADTVNSAAYTELLKFLLQEDNEVITSALCSVAAIAPRPDGTETFVGAGTLGVLATLTRSQSDCVRKWACELLERLADYQSTGICVLELNPRTHLSTLLRFSPAVPL
ncbi:armadillo-type protein [Mycena rebaudengoi]|nr:armadillo-type protein [Mycena rebaudengoi]